MTLRLGDIAPDFTADTTEGKIKFHEWLGNSWGVLFSHPKNYTPVCTTELGYTAKLKPEFDRRNVKAIGLSVDKLEDHHGWSKDIEETQGASLNFPLIDSLQLTDMHKVATPVNWKQGEDVIIVPAVKDEDARKLFPEGWKTLKPYLR